MLLALAVASCEWMGAQTATILPAPVEMTMQEGYFRLMDGMTICAEKMNFIRWQIILQKP